MSMKLNDIVQFREDLLFNGAVNIDWFCGDPQKAKTASENFVFHGPKYHGVSQKDVGDQHGHRLVDTANFARSVVRICYGLEDQPFTLAIAGYGTGKSHLGLTLANLLSNPKGETAQRILSAIGAADSEICTDLKLILNETIQPCLTVTLNGMRGFDLSAEITKQILNTLIIDGHDTKLLDDLRPRFGQAVALVKMSNESVIKNLLNATNLESITKLIYKLEQQDEMFYAIVHDFFAERGMPIRVLSGESVRDVIDIAVSEYCGPGKPYRSLIILFDEFGKYTEFATVRSQIAGSGVLQNLFEGIQANANNACFVGFIQFELNAYVQRIAPEFKNEILRFITRFQSANKLYLSINLETLIASLLKKRKGDMFFDRIASKQLKLESRELMNNIAKWFPQSQNHHIWCNEPLFHSVIREGCWPLSPYSTWFLFYLASAGKHLQERSALALLGDAIMRFNMVVVEDDSNWTIGPTELWSEVLLQEFLSSEELGQQGSITHALISVIAKQGHHFSQEQIKLLHAIVIASKLGLFVSRKDEAIQALVALSSVPQNVAEREIKCLQEEYNVIEWDNAFKAFDILGDAVPRTQFIAFIRQHVSISYDEIGKATLFASHAEKWCNLLVNLECDFAEENKISTREWRYTVKTSNLNFLSQQIKISSDRWLSAIGTDEERGTIIYTYIGQSQSIDDAVITTSKLLRLASKEVNIIALPILVILLHDEDGFLGQSLAEYAVLADISDVERAKFGNLVDAHKEKLLNSIRENISMLIKKRYYITAFKDGLKQQRLNQVGTELFKKIYKNPIAFPFDGFSTARGNAADTCNELTRELLLGKLDYDGVIAKPVKVKNRALTVLKDTWGIFNKNGTISRRPMYSVIKLLSEKWDEILSKEQKLSLGDALRQLCNPPYGANIASAGLFLGVYMASRQESLAIIKGNESIGISNLIQEGFFKGKFINLLTLHDVKLVVIGASTSEWETLLDEWEYSTNYLSKIEYLNRSEKLKERFPIPPTLVYREERLMELAKDAIKKLRDNQNIQKDAWNKIEKSQNKQSCSLAAWGAANLKDLYDSMKNEQSLWNDELIDNLDSDYMNARQYAIQFFPEWVKGQTPISDNPSAVGDFRHMMINRIGTNLQKIGLDEEYKKLEEHTYESIKNAERIAECKQLLRDVNSWLLSHSDAANNSHILEIRNLKKVGVDYFERLERLPKKFKYSDLIQRKDQLLKFIKKLTLSEEKIISRASALWESKLCSENDIDKISTEVDSLIHSFENLPNDLEDLLSMKKVLKIYLIWHQQLSERNMNGDEFSGIIEKLQEEKELILEEEVPWSAEEVIDLLVKNISSKRENISLSWILKMKEKVSSVGIMIAVEANSLYRELQNTPQELTEDHYGIVTKLFKQVEDRLNNLKIEWLVEKFKELDSNNKIEFLNIVKDIIK